MSEPRIGESYVFHGKRTRSVITGDGQTFTLEPGHWYQVTDCCVYHRRGRRMFHVLLGDAWPHWCLWVDLDPDESPSFLRDQDRSVSR